MYRSVTLLFPGQGSQYVGMGKALEGCESFKLFERANSTLGYPLTQLMFEGPLEELTLTQNTQPAILTHSVALFEKTKKVLEQKNIAIDRVLGHSVGEYAALVAAGTLSFDDAVMAVHLRGKYMQEATPRGLGKMFAMMRVPPEVVEQACREVSRPDSVVMPANFNEPGQTVISGEADACLRAVKWVEQSKEGTRFKALELNVSAPFHSSLMEPAAQKLESAFNKFTFNPLRVPYVANIDAREYPVGTTGETIKNNLIAQVCGSVKWSQSMAQLSPDTLCLEMGPSKVLFGLARKINRDLKVISMDQEDAFEQLEGALS